MKSFFLKNKLILVILGIFLLIVASVSFWVFPLLGKIKKISQQVQEEIIDREIENKRFGKISNMEKDWLDFESRRSFLEVVVNQENQIKFIEGLEKIAEQTGNSISLKIGENADPKEITKLKKMSRKKGEDEKGILDEVSYGKYFPIQINLKGDYPGLYKFISMLENNQFYVNMIIFETKKQAVDAKGNERKDFFEKESDNLSRKEILETDISAIVYTLD